MQHKIINLPGYGKVKCGKITTAKDCSVEVENYFGIPFARPPVGKLRFMPPQRAEPWPGVLSNQRPYKIPMQNNGFGKLAAIFRPTKDMFQDKHLSEDCLYLNVYVPKHVSSKKLPVMVWIYGGSFQTGPNMYMDGTALAAMNEVIVVVPNYRVGLLGFFSLGHQTDCKGNMGLLDQLESLRWVRENIEYFGGDRNNVTIFGESAGGISVNMHMKSQLSVGYFQKAISHSGVAVLPMIYYPSQQRVVNLFLEKLKIKEREPNKVLEI
uniref:Carboxylic ester hydrolase n=1 Tax=Ciona savignyi TaxID=51511 RepID=H2YX81_CIOSA